MTIALPDEAGDRNSCGFIYFLFIFQRNVATSAASQSLPKACMAGQVTGFMHITRGSQLLNMFHPEPWLHFCQLPVVQMSWLISHIAAAVAHLSWSEVLSRTGFSLKQYRLLQSTPGGDEGTLKSKSRSCSQRPQSSPLVCLYRCELVL